MQTQEPIQGSLHCAFAKSANASVEMTRFLLVRGKVNQKLRESKGKRNGGYLELGVLEVEAGFELVGVGQGYGFRVLIERR